MAEEPTPPAADPEVEGTFLAGAVRGVRMWEADKARGGHPRLRGFGGWHWQPFGRPSVAECLSPSGKKEKSHRDASAPAIGCTCGLYAHHPWARDAWQDFDLLSGSGPNSQRDDWILGVVEAWGHLEVHADGFRAQRARPVLLIGAADADPEALDLIRRMGEEYRCGWQAVDSVEALEDLLDRVEGGLDRGLVGELVESAVPEHHYTNYPPYVPPPPLEWENWRDRPRIVLEAIGKVSSTTLDWTKGLFEFFFTSLFFLFALLVNLTMYGIVIWLVVYIAIEIIKDL